MSPAGIHNLVGAVGIGQAMLVANRPFFGKSRRGDRPPARPLGWAFLLFFIDLSFLLFRRGLGFLALILPLIGSLACVDLVGF